MARPFTIENSATFYHVSFRKNDRNRILETQKTQRVGGRLSGTNESLQPIKELMGPLSQ